MGKNFSLGVDFETGEYLESPSSLEEVGELVEERTCGEERKYSRKRDKLESASLRPLLPPQDLDVNNLAQTGWAVIFAEGVDSAVRRELQPLLEHRKAAATGLRETGYRGLVGQFDYQSGDSREDFLDRWKVGSGTVVATERLPYYLLLVGSPRQIPFEIQYELAIDYAVGRLWFDTPEEYGSYVRNLLESEANKSLRRRRAVLFGARHEGDRATEATSGTFVQSLGANVHQKFPNWKVETIVAAEATKSRLSRLLSEDPPAFLLTAGHGILCPRSDPRQGELQGALICDGWRPKTPLEPEHFFTAADLPAGADLQGLVAFLFACSSIGTPDRDDFYSFTEDKFLGTKEPFHSRLPQRLLTQGAAAVIGHVDRVWLASFLYDQYRTETTDIEVFKEIMRLLLSGYRVGHAMGPMARRFAALGAGVLNQQLRRLRRQTVDRQRLGDLWLRSNDARNYLLLGDPAVQLTFDAPVSFDAPV